ncbi:pentapeptide repeat-containing protein [Bacillus horti]|uniref:Pentapeptide repeat-containing protein n=1 Tax=Caldalkalibacillus horti TaxID=77523 RepID=A0ABT9VXT8_9BACI|nr:pentapeptide repeat-containing protein [Bacillus horti]MDQ0165808.1 hypothetical protein [Bacillus horti]
MSDLAVLKNSGLLADCEQCFGLCCVALPYAKSADFASNKDGGTPCSNLTGDYRCGIHSGLREKGFRGCTVYECYGAGQKVSQITYAQKSWKVDSVHAKEMFELFPIMQQLHEMMYYLHEALELERTRDIHSELRHMLSETEALTFLHPDVIFAIDLAAHRTKVNELLLEASRLVRSLVMLGRMNKPKQEGKGKEKRKQRKGTDFIGAKLKGISLSGESLRGALFIACDLRNADLSFTDLIGADFRDADLRGATLTGSLFLTQAQLNAANGDRTTKLPSALKHPEHWPK